MTRYHREPIQTWRRKVKLTLAAMALLGLLVGLLSVALESTDEAGGPRDRDDESLFDDDSPSHSSGADNEDAAPIWFMATGGGRR